MLPDFAEVYDDHLDAVYAFLAYRLGRRQDAEDLTQATFERALRAWSRYDASRSSPRTWLLSIANNLLIDHYRAGRAVREAPLGSEPGGLDGQEGVEGPEADLGLSVDVAAALDSLGERDRRVVALRYGADLSGPEIAELLGLSLANVQQILSRSLRRMRRILDARPAGDSAAVERSSAAG